MKVIKTPANPFMRFAHHDVSRRLAFIRRKSDVSRAVIDRETMRASMSVDFQPPSVLEGACIEVAPFVVGRDTEGHWVACDMSGRRGGLFVSKAAAIDFAEFETGWRPGAIVTTDAPLQLRF